MFHAFCCSSIKAVIANWALETFSQGLENDLPQKKSPATNSNRAHPFTIFLVFASLSEFDSVPLIGRWFNESRWQGFPSAADENGTPISSEMAAGGKPSRLTP